MELRSTPYWWEAAPLDATPPAALPEQVEVAVVGAGYAGLTAALTLARAGREVLVLDARQPGEGASTRSGGMIGSGHRLGLGALTAMYGKERALAVMREGLQALDFTTGLIEREAIACDLVRCGRFRGAWTPAHYDAMARDIDAQRKEVGLEADMVGRAEAAAEVATGRYHGGAIFHRHGGLHPARFHAGLLRLARGAGARVEGQAAVRAIEADGRSFALRTARGMVRADAVLVATNGYEPGAAGLRRRVVPVPSFLVATEELGDDRVKALIPGGRMIVETRAAHCYYRPSPDGRRLVLGGRAALHPVPPERAAGRLRQLLASLFPELATVGLSHSWSGNVAMTRTGHPGIGRDRRGVWHALGCCGSGVAMMPYLGWRLAQKVLGTAEARTAFDDLPFRPWPLHAGYPLARPLLSAWWRLVDRREERTAQA